MSMGIMKRKSESDTLEIADGTDRNGRKTKERLPKGLAVV